MKTFLKSSDFAPKETVSLYDKVCLVGDLYLIDGFSLALCSGETDNDRVFNLLEIEDKKEYCSKYYGYDTHWHYGFPRPRSGDYEALTRVIIALMKQYEKPNFGLLVRKFIRKHFDEVE